MALNGPGYQGLSEHIQGIGCSGCQTIFPNIGIITGVRGFRQGIIIVDIRPGTDSGSDRPGTDEILAALGKHQIALIALAQEKEDAALRYETVRQEMAASAEAERRRLDNRLDALITENRALNTALVLLEAELTEIKQAEAGRSTEELVSEERLAEVEQIISDLEREIADLETRLADSNTFVDTGEMAIQWRLYGVIVQIRGEILVIEPLTNQIPPTGSEIRVMRSLGKDRVIHLADGSILEANATRATSRLSSVSNGAQNYGSPEIDDLIYVVTP